MGSRKGIPHRKWGKEDKLKYVKMHFRFAQMIGNPYLALIYKQLYFTLPIP